MSYARASFAQIARRAGLSSTGLISYVNTLRVAGKCLAASGGDFENPQSGRCLLDPGESIKSGTQLRLGQCDSSLTSNADWSQFR